jgi:N-glycosylase/DNA lyase
MEYFYFNEEDTDIKVIHAFAKEKWGNLAGYAQQYLFYYARTLKLGKKDSKIQKTK